MFKIVVADIGSGGFHPLLNQWGQRRPELTMPTRPGLSAPIVRELETDAYPAARHPHQFAERPRGLPPRQLLAGSLVVFGLRINPDDFAHQDGFGALPQGVPGELDRDMNPRRLHL